MERPHKNVRSGKELEAAGTRVIDKISSDEGGCASLLSGVTVIVGQGPRVEGGGLVPAPTLNPEANIATIEFKLLSAQQRQLSTRAVVDAWREEVGLPPYVRGLTFSGEIIDLGNPVEPYCAPGSARLRCEFRGSQPPGVGGAFDSVRSFPGIRESAEFACRSTHAWYQLEELAQNRSILRCGLAGAARSEEVKAMCDCRQ